MTTKRKSSGGNPRDPEEMTERLLKNAERFADDLVLTCGVPGVYAYEYVGVMLRTEIDRQCASCGVLHQGISSLAYFQQAQTNTTVLWSRCDACSAVMAGGDLGAVEALEATAVETLVKWADRSVEPSGVVIIFNFGKKSKG